MSRAKRVVVVCALALMAGCQATPPNPSATSPAATSAASATEATSSGTPVSSPIASPAASPTVEPAGSEPPGTPGPAWTGQPQPSLALPASGAPAVPTRVAMVDSGVACDFGTAEACERWKVSWLESNPTDVAIRVYGVTTCLHEPTASSEGTVKCLRSGDFIPPSSLVLLASAPASDGSTTLDLAIGETSAVGWLPGAGPIVYAVIVQAVNDKGGSIFAFALVSGSCWGCVL